MQSPQISLAPESYQPGFVKTCSIWRALDVVGDKPILLILESIWMGSSRFGKIGKTTGLLKALLSSRLKRLIDKGLLVKRLRSGSTKSYEYALTPQGGDLFGVVLMLYRWERKWGTSKSRLHSLLQHNSCGAEFIPETRCGSCCESYSVKDIEWTEGPGTGWMPAAYNRRRNQAKGAFDQSSMLRGSIDILGDRWAALIMRAVFVGQRRFDEILAETGAAPNILSTRIKKLAELKVLRAKPYQETPVRLEYHLTTRGMDYYEVIISLMMWGDKYYPSEAGPPIYLTHNKCGLPLEPKIVCGNCEAEATPRDITIIPDAETVS